MGRTKETARMSTSGPAPKKQHATRARRRLFPSDHGATNPTTKTVRTKKGYTITKSSNAGSSLIKSAHISEAKNSLQVANTWMESALCSVKRAEKQYTLAKQQLQDARDNALLAQKTVENAKILVEKLEKDYEVVGLDDDSDVEDGDM